MVNQSDLELPLTIFPRREISSLLPIFTNMYVSSGEHERIQQMSSQNAFHIFKYCIFPEYKSLRSLSRISQKMRHEEEKNIRKSQLTISRIYLDIYFTKSKTKNRLISPIWCSFSLIFASCNFLSDIFLI